MNNSLLKISFIFILLSVIMLLQSCTGCSNSGKRGHSTKISNEEKIVKPKMGSKEIKKIPSPKKNIIDSPKKEKKNIETPEIINRNKENPNNNNNNNSTTKKTVSELFKELQSGVFMVFALDNDGSGAQGSGFFINENGIGVTNYHVLEGYDNYSIQTSNGKTYRITEILAFSKPDDNDYVIFKIDTRNTKFNFVPIASKKSLIGDDIFVIGSPKGLENSLTKGSVSQYRGQNRIQIDATIEHGSSGGPLFNMNGEVIGITTSKLKDTDAALNFAIDIQAVPYKKYVKNKTAPISVKNEYFLHPTSTTNHIIKHTYFTVSYHEEHEQAEWVAYKIDAYNNNSKIKRTNDYRHDPFVTTRSAHPNDFKNSGYDMGHLAPAGIMKHNYQSMSESFYLSNISPQVKHFNRGIWKRLESKVKYWANFNDSIYVITGPILDQPITKIGNNKVSVPRAFYKVLLRFKGSKTEGIAFLIENKKSNKSIYSYATSINYIEKLTGLDFFYKLNSEIQRRVEANNDIKLWALN